MSLLKYDPIGTAATKDISASCGWRWLTVPNRQYGDESSSSSGNGKKRPTEMRRWQGDMGHFGARPSSSLAAVTAPAPPQTDAVYIRYGEYVSLRQFRPLGAIENPSDAKTGGSV